MGVLLPIPLIFCLDLAISSDSDTSCTCCHWSVLPKVEMNSRVML